MLPSFKKIAAGVLSLALAVSLVPFSGAKANWNQIRLIKVAGSPAVYLADSTRRYAFIDSEVYFEWLPNFNGVQTVSTAELNNLQLAGNAFFPAGTLVQFRPVAGVIRAYDPAFNVFVVGRNGQLMRAAGSAGLSALATVFGANWQSMVYTANDVFLSGYTYGADYTSPMLVDGMFVRKQGDTQVFYIDGTTRRPVDSNGLTANSVQPMRIKTVPANLVDALTTGPAITAADDSLSPLSNQTVSSSSSSGSTPVAQQGSLTATLSTDTPASAVIPAGAVRAPFANFRLTAGSEEARVTSITVRRIGAGSPADFKNVYLFRGMERLTLGRTINNSSNTATFSGLNLTIPAGQSVVLSLVADINDQNVSGNVSAFEISTASDIVGPTSINGQFPLRGNLMSFSQAQSGQLTIIRTGSPQNPKVGDTNVLLSSFRLQAGTQEDQSIRSISVYQAGSVERSQLLNLKLVQAGNVVATASGVDGQNRVNFNFTTPFAMQRGDSRTFEIRGDIGLQARVNTTIQFYLDQDSDLLSIGQTFGYGVRVINTGAQAYDSTVPTLTLTGAQLRVNFTGPGATDVPRNRNDVTLYTGTMSAQANLEVRKVNVTFESSTALGTSSSTYYTNIKLVNADTGQTLFGPADLPSGTGTSYSVDLQGPFSFTPGQSINFRIIANLNSGIAADSTIKVRLNALPSADVRNLDTGLNVPAGDIVPATALAGNTHTVRASALTVQLANSPANQSYTRGTLQKDLIGIILSATNAQSVQLRSLTMQTYIGPSAGALCAAGSSVQFNPTTDVVNCVGGVGFTAVSAKDRIALIQLIDQGTGQPIGDAKSVDTNGQLNFINLNLNIPAGSSKTVLARMDISNNAILGSTNQFLPYRISADVLGTGTNYSSVISANDSEGNTADVTGPTGNINNTVNPTTAITVIGTGSVSVSSINSDPAVQSQLIVGGANAIPVANFRFSAVNEDIKLSKLKVQIVDSANAPIPNNVQSVWIVDGSTVYGQGGKGATSGISIDSSGLAKFDGLDIMVPKDGDKTIQVRVDTKTVSGGAISGSQFRAILIAASAGDVEIEAQGTGSGSRLNGTSVSGITTAAGTTVRGDLHKIYRSAPTISRVPVGENGVTPTTGLKIFRFTVGADAKGTIGVKQVTFSVTGTNTAANLNLANFQLFDVTGTQQLLAGSAAVTGSFPGTATVRYTFTAADGLEVAAGTSRTLELRADVTGATPGASISVQALGGDSNINSAASAGLLAGNNFVWTDISQSTRAGATDFNNGYLVKNLPTAQENRQNSF